MSSSGSLRERLDISIMDESTEISEWLKYAKHDLKDAEVRIEVGTAPRKLILEDCQQALEWISKAFFAESWHRFFLETQPRLSVSKDRLH